MSTMQVDFDNLLLTPDKPIVRALIRKKELLEAGDAAHRDIRPLLIILGGGMCSVAGGCRVCAQSPWFEPDL